MILSEIKKLTRHTAVYGSGNLLAKLVGFIMIPFYTHYLTTADYGTLELLDLSLSLAGLLLTMWMNASIVRQYYEYDDQKNRNCVVSTTLIAAGAVGVAVASCGVILSRPLAGLILEAPDLHYYVTLISISFALSTLNAVCWTYLRTRQQSTLVVGTDLLNLVLTLGLNIYFIAFLKTGLVGVLYSSLIASCFVTTILTAYTIRDVGLGFSSRKLKEVAAFGAPLVVNAVAIYALNFSDRFFLRRYASISDVGIYALGYKFGFMLNFLIVQPFDMIWSVRMYEIYKAGKSGELFPRMLEYYTLALVTAALALGLIAKELIRVIAAPEFLAAYKVIPIVALAYVFQGWNRYFVAGAFIAKKTMHLAAIGVLSAVVTLLLNFILISRYRMMGAAWATLLGFMVMAALAYLVSQRVHRVQYGFLRVSVLFAVGVALYLASTLPHVESLALAASFKILLLGAFPVILYLLRFFEKREIDGIKGLIGGQFLRFRAASASRG